MLKVILATHGRMADGMKSSLEKILGTLDNVICLNAYEGEENVKTLFAKAMEQVEAEDVCLVCTDLCGGSVNQQILDMADLDRVYLFSGVNLPFLLEVVLMDPKDVNERSLKEALQIGKEQLVYAKDVLEEYDDDDDDFA